jgi:hypothetical protein
VAHSKLRSTLCALAQAGMPAAPIPQPMMQPKVPSMWAQPGTYQPEADRPHFETELEINDFPQHARWKVIPRLPSLVKHLVPFGNHYTLVRAMLHSCCSAVGPVSDKLFVWVHR